MTKSPYLFAFFLVGIGFIGIIGILLSSFVALVTHTRSRCKYANRRNSHQIVKRSRVQLSPFSLNPTIAPFKYSPRFNRRLPPGNGTCSAISRASKDWFEFYFGDESTSWLYHQLLDPSHLILAERGRLIDAAPESPLIYNRGQKNTNTPKILCWIKTYKSLVHREEATS